MGKLWRAGVVLAASAAAVPWLLAAAIDLLTRSRRVRPGQLPAVEVALVLGTEVYPRQRPSALLAARLDLALELWADGRVRRLLVSGDGQSPFYDEPGTMRHYLLERGVPAAAIWSDPSGLDTWDSCRRAREVFGLDRLVVVSQSFHLPRALLACRWLGVDAWGVGADAVPGDSLVRHWSARELAANLKLLLDLARDVGRRGR